MRGAELCKLAILPEEYKLRVLVLPPLQPAFCKIKPKAHMDTSMFAAAPLSKHMDFRIMITEGVYAVQ